MKIIYNRIIVYHQLRRTNICGSQYLELFYRNRNGATTSDQYKGTAKFYI